MSGNQGWSAGEENNGVYSGTQNDNPTSSGVVLQERSPSPAPSKQTQQQTAVRSTTPDNTVVAADVSIHDADGNAFGTDNPLPVILTDGSITIGTVNANLEVFLTAKDNDPKAGDIHDSIRIGDGINEIAVNSDGSINVNINTVSAGITPVNVYNEAGSVASGIPTQVATYLVPVGKKGVLSRIECGGENIALYTVKVNGTSIARTRTYFGGDLQSVLDFALPGNQGYSLAEGDIITVSVLHSRTALSNHEARIQLILI